MKTALITGAAGAIGGHVARTLAARGWRVLGIGHGAPEDMLAGWHGGEIEATALDALTESARPEAIIHLAGGSSVGPSLADPRGDRERTVASTRRLLDWMARGAPDAALVQASSAAVYGDAALVPIGEDAPTAPVSPYGKHKLMMEETARDSGLNVVSLRLFSVYGPGLHKQLVWELASRLARGQRRLVLGGTGAETRDWLHISDAANMLVAAIALARPDAPVFNGCTGQGTSVATVARAVMAGFGGEAELAFSGESRTGDPVHLVGDASNAERAGLKAYVAATHGLAATARHIRAELGL